MKTKIYLFVLFCLLASFSFAQSVTTVSPTRKGNNFVPEIIGYDDYSSSSYVVKYTTYQLGGKTALNSVNMPLEIGNNRITVHNTKSGKKYWDVEYMGTVSLSKYNNFRFKKYYLTNKRVYFYISEQKVFTGPNNVKYYMIDFDGEIQFAI